MIRRDELSEWIHGIEESVGRLKHYTYDTNRIKENDHRISVMCKQILKQAEGLVEEVSK